MAPSTPANPTTPLLTSSSRSVAFTTAPSTPMGATPPKWPPHERRSSYNPEANCHLSSSGDGHAHGPARGRERGGSTAARRKKLDTKAERDKRRLMMAIALSVIFFLVEIVGGIWAGSLALFSDSFHLLSDVLGFAISLAALHLAQMPASSTHSYGYYRAEILGALFSIFFIWVLTAVLVWEAVQRILNPEPIDAPIMFGVALAGVVVNIILAIVLGHGHDHDHDHGHGHGGEAEQGQGTGSESSEDGSSDGEEEELIANGDAHDHADGGHDHGHDHADGGHEHDHGANGHDHGAKATKGHNHETHENINISSATLHVLGDLVSSIGVLIASVVIYFNPSATYADPICTLLFSLIVLATTFRLASRAVTVLMEAAPAGLDLRLLARRLRRIPGVSGVHDLHAWALTVGRAAVTVHVTVGKEQDTPEAGSKRPTDVNDVKRVLHEAEFVVCKEFGIHHSTVQVEVEGWETWEEGRHDHGEGAGQLHCAVVDGDGWDGEARGEA
ncbi:cation efflux protein [Gonapodya prolifera JEL478]|uniref:Cation efflux protein n=1 Tax=Gonapodya prolifera (strain JEL478) TaxID=1344416 RepID=A0A139AHD5_GONPJ|nr:cation efflux protein [Gonapodya prolifera JEL478]|eukprot:KXS16207.1 cation efflux protein [Gonapodya prolifera JEL478]